MIGKHFHLEEYLEHIVLEFKKKQSGRCLPYNKKIVLQRLKCAQSPEYGMFIGVNG